MRTKRASFGLLLASALLLALLLAGCGGSYVCSDCGGTFSGASYYGLYGDETMCPDCAKEYWVPFNYKNYKN